MSNPNATAALSQIILMEAMFAHRGDPLAMPADTKLTPQRLNVNISASPFTDQGAVAVRVSVTTDASEEGVLYDFAISLAGILARTQSTPPEWGEREFAEIGMMMLYPFVREAVANITGRGRFGPVWLNPFNVRELFKGFDQQQEVVSAAG